MRSWSTTAFTLASCSLMVCCAEPNPPTQRAGSSASVDQDHREPEMAEQARPYFAAVRDARFPTPDTGDAGTFAIRTGCVTFISDRRHALSSRVPGRDRIGPIRRKLGSSPPRRARVARTNVPAKRRGRHLSAESGASRDLPEPALPCRRSSMSPSRLTEARGSGDKIPNRTFQPPASIEPATNRLDASQDGSGRWRHASAAGLGG